MTKDETLKLALEALELIGMKNWSLREDKAITAIKEALAQPEQEPVAWMNDMGMHIDLNVSGRGTPLYTTPPQRTWVGLTADEMEGLYQLATYMDETDYIHMLMMAEDKLKEKNT